MPERAPILYVALPWLVRGIPDTTDQMRVGTDKPRWGLVSIVRYASLNVPVGSALALVPNAHAIVSRSQPTIASPPERSDPRPAGLGRPADLPIGAADHRIPALAEGGC